MIFHVWLCLGVRCAPVTFGRSWFTRIGLADPNQASRMSHGSRVGGVDSFALSLGRLVPCARMVAIGSYAPF